MSNTTPCRPLPCRSLLARTLALALAPVLLLAAVAAQKSDLKRALPENTICYLAVPDIDTSLTELKQMPLGKMWAEKEVQDFFADLLKMVDQQWKQGMQMAAAEFERQKIPFSPDDVVKLRVHGLTLALTTLDLKIGDGEGAMPRPRIGALAHFDFGDSAPTWAKLIDFGLAQLQKAEPSAETSERQVAGCRVITVNGKHNPTDMALHVAFVGNGLLVGTLDSEVASTLEAMKQTRGVLTESRNYKTTFAQLDTKGAEMELWFQPRPVIEFGLKALDIAAKRHELPQEVNVAGIRRVIEVLGLDSIHGIGVTSTYAGDRCVSKSYVHAPKPTRKGLFAGSSKPLSLDFLRWVPKDASSVNAFTFDLAPIYDTIVQAIDAYDPEVGKQVIGMLGAVEKKIGISLKEDLINSLGDEMIHWGMPFQALGSTPAMQFLIKMRDEQRFVKTLDTLTKLSDGHVELLPVERSGVKMNHLKINLDMGGGPIDLSSMISPYFSFKNGYLVAAMSAQDVKRTLERLDRADDPKGDVRANPEFAPYLGKLPKEPVSSLSFSDWKASFEGAYQIIASLLAFVPIPDEAPIDLSLLPDVGTLTKHLCGAVSYNIDDGNGWSSVSIGPFGPEVFAVLAVGIGGGVGIFTARQAVPARKRGGR